MATSSNIKNVGTANKPLEKVQIWRTSRLEDTLRAAETLLGDFTPDSDEKLITLDQLPEASVLNMSSAITVSIAND